MTISALYHVILQLQGSKAMKKLSTLLSSCSSLGKITISMPNEDSVQLTTSNELDHALEVERARAHLEALHEKIGLIPPHSQLSKRILENLIEAESIVHSCPEIMNPDLWDPESIHFERMVTSSLKRVKISFSSTPNNQKSKQLELDENHFQGHHHLHEASDIIIDASLVAWCLQELNINVKEDVYLLSPVKIGGGQVNFSHGTFKVPVPAVKYLLDVHHIPHEKGPVARELVTPTGAAILSALKPKFITKLEFKEFISRKNVVLGKGMGHAQLKNIENAVQIYYLPSRHET